MYLHCVVPWTSTHNKTLSLLIAIVLLSQQVLLTEAEGNFLFISVHILKASQGFPNKPVDLGSKIVPRWGGDQKILFGGNSL